MDAIEKYGQAAVDRAESSAEEWLSENDVGAPRSWEQEAKDAARRGYEMYDLEAPPIAGYEALEAKGLVVRGDRVTGRAGQERIRFTKSAAWPDTKAGREDTT